MKKILLIQFLVIFSIGMFGCAVSSQPIQQTAVITANTLQIVNTSAPTMVSKTPYPTLTHRPTYTPSLTPTLARIPKSTFDPARAVLQTPLPPAQCPRDAQDVSLPDLEMLNQSQEFFEKTVLDVLNSGGISRLLPMLSEENRYTTTRADVTHDQVPELIVENRTGFPGFLSVFGCQAGQYKKLLSVDAVYDYAPRVLKIKDMNRNGMPDLTLRLITCSVCSGVLIFEWDGQEFQSLAGNWFLDPSLNEVSFYPGIGLDGYGDVRIVDIDENGTDEIVLQGGAPGPIGGDMYLNGPYRSITLIYMWDGQHYSQYSRKYSAPEYRFQAIQDGDDAALAGRYEEALAYYQDAIFSDQLKGWSEAEKENLVAQGKALYSTTPSPTSLPPHNEDYLPLAAYARYRIMLLHAMNGFQQDAQVVYDTLQEKFPEGNAGHPYAEMASVFWEEFLRSRDMEQSCQQAIDYAKAHGAILLPLGGPEFSFWSKSYMPYDVCPFPNN